VLNHRGCSCSNVACPMQEYHDNIGDLDGPEEKERAQGRTKEIIASLSL
jgi:beta-catenin-like protein 1